MPLLPGPLGEDCRPAEDANLLSLPLAGLCHLEWAIRMDTIGIRRTDAGELIE